MTTKTTLIPPPLFWQSQLYYMSSIRHGVSHYTILSTLLSLETTSFATLPSCSSNIQFNIIFSFTLSTWMRSLLISFPYSKHVCVFVTHACWRPCQSHASWFDRPNNIARSTNSTNREASHYGIPSDFLSLGSKCGSLPPGSCNNENKFLVLVREHMMLTNFAACPGVSQQHCHLQCWRSDLSCQHLMTLLCFHSHPGLPLQNHNEIHASWPAPLTINHSVYQVHNIHWCCPSACLRVVWFREKTSIISLNNIKWLVFATVSWIFLWGKN